MAWSRKRSWDLEVQDRTNLHTGEREWVYNVGAPGPAAWVRVPYYTRNVAACSKVEIWLAANGWMSTEPPTAGPTGHFVAVFEHRDGRIVKATGPYEEAVCRAALKVVAE